MDNPARVLLISPHGSYRIAPFLKAAKTLDIPVMLVTDGPKLPLPQNLPGLHLDFSADPNAIETLCSQLNSVNIRGVVATDDSTLVLAASVAEKIGIPHNSIESAQLSRRKDSARERQRINGLPTPWFLQLDMQHPLDVQIQSVNYPCVVKPIAMSASRGVIRADNRDQLVTAIRRVEKLVNSKATGDAARYLLLESFISGTEIAVEGLLSDGNLQILTIFDKPGVSQGPYFEETCYVAPSALPDETVLLVSAEIQKVCEAYGLVHGPIHAECRLNADGIWILEIGARTIGGLCAKLFKDLIGIGLESPVR
ncbi:acetyl-CoA carboxylase biotin carboxylase subunit family protein [Pseudomonadota bacterium]